MTFFEIHCFCSGQNFDMLKGSLKGQIGADTKDMDEEKSAKAANEEQKTTDSGDLTMTEGYR